MVLSLTSRLSPPQPDAFNGAYTTALDGALLAANSITGAYAFVMHFQAPAWVGPLLSAVGLGGLSARTGDDAPPAARPFTMDDEHWHATNEGLVNAYLAAAGADIIPPPSPQHTHHRDSMF
jgi:hypothetical protein